MQPIFSYGTLVCLHIIILYNCNMAPGCNVIFNKACSYIVISAKNATALTFTHSFLQIVFLVTFQAFSIIPARFAVCPVVVISAIWNDRNEQMFQNLDYKMCSFILSWVSKWIIIAYDNPLPRSLCIH